MKEEKQSLFRNHADTVAIIATNVGLFLSMAAIMIALWISNSNRVDNAHNRIDNTNTRIDSLHSSRNQDSPKYSMSWKPYEDIVPQPNDWMINDPSIKKGD